MQRIIRGLACVQALRRGRGVLLGFLDGVGRRSCGDAALPLDQVHNVERDDGDKAAEDDRHHEPQRAAVGQELPDDEGDGAGEDGDHAGVLRGLRNGKAEAVGRERACAADAECEGVHGDEGDTEHGDAHGDERRDDVAETGVEDDLLVLELLLAAEAGVDVVDDHRGHAQQVGVCRGHGRADDGGGDEAGDDAGRIGAGDDHHGVGAVLSKAGQLVLQSEGSEAEEGREDGHGSHQDGAEEGRADCSLLVLAGLETGDHLGAAEEGAEVVEEIADDGGPADLGHVQLFAGQSCGDGLPAARVLQDDRGGDRQADENDAELDEVGDLVRDHAAEGGIEDGDKAGQQQADVQGDRRDQSVDDRAGSADLGRRQAEQRQNAEHGGEVAGELAEAAADDLGDRDSHGLADLGSKISQGDHRQGRRQDVPDRADAPRAEGLLGQARGGAAADVVGGQGERDHEQAHSAASNEIVSAALDVDLADDIADDHHADHVRKDNDQCTSLNFHIVPHIVPP